MSVNEKMTLIADAIRDKTEETGVLTLDDIAEKIPQVYNAGKDKQYNDFWDSYQDNGNRDSYEHAFAGLGWTNETFKPKYDILPQQADNLFARSRIYGSLPDILEKSGVTLDFSEAGSAKNTFQNSKFSRIGVVDLKSAMSAFYLFYDCSELETINNLIIYNGYTGEYSWKNMFNYSGKLKNITISGEGSIKNSCELSHTKVLSKASIINVINYLSDDVSGQTLFLSSQAVTTAFGSTSSQEWLELVGTKPNWTISIG